MVMGAYTGAGAPPPGIQVRHSAAVSGCFPVLSYASCTAWPHFEVWPHLARMIILAKDGVRRCQHQFPHSESILAIRAQADSRALGRQPPCRPLCQHPAAPPVQPCPLLIPGERPRIPASPLCSRCCTEVQLHQHRQRTMCNRVLSMETPDTAATRCTGSRK